MTFHEGDFDIFGAGLDDFEQTLDGEFNRVLFGEVVCVVFLEEFADGFGGSTDGVCLPSRVHATRFRLEQLWLCVIRIEPDDQGRNAKGTDTAGLGVLLLDASNVACNIVDRYRVLNRKAVRLAFGTCLVDEDACVGSETGESETDVIIEHGGLADGASVLQLQNGFLLYSEDNDVLAAYANGTGTLAHCFERIFDLEAAESEQEEEGQLEGVVLPL